MDLSKFGDQLERSWHTNQTYGPWNKLQTSRRVTNGGDSVAVRSFGWLSHSLCCQTVRREDFFKVGTDINDVEFLKTNYPHMQPFSGKKQLEVEMHFDQVFYSIDPPAGVF